MKTRALGIVLSLAINLSFPLFSYAESYPPKIQKYIDKTTVKAVCEKEKPRKVGTVIYKNESDDWLMRIFTKDGEELEIWLNDKRKLFAEYRPDAVYYRKPNQGWINKKDISKKEAEELDKRLKFTNEEINFFVSCAKEKTEK